VKLNSKVILVLVFSLALALVGLSGFFQKDKAASSKEEKTTVTTTDQNEGSGTDEETETEEESETAAAGETESNSEANSESKTDSNTSTESNSKTDSQTGSNTGSKTEEPKSKEELEDEAKAVNDLVLANTKIVQISNIAKRSHELYPDAGPFYVVRGMDMRGQVSEIWIKDMQIYEMITAK
jgi:FtsZ-interacting cell division protein ZipA